MSGKVLSGRRAVVRTSSIIRLTGKRPRIAPVFVRRWACREVRRENFSPEEDSGDEEQRQGNENEHKKHKCDQAPDVRPTLLIPIIRLRRPPASGAEVRRRGMSRQAVRTYFRVHEDSSESNKAVTQILGKTAERVVQKICMLLSQDRRRRIEIICFGRGGRRAAADRRDQFFLHLHGGSVARRAVFCQTLL